MNKLYIGIDISKKTLDVDIKSKHFKFQNNEKGHKMFLAELKKLDKNVHCVCESTGIYGLDMALFLVKNNIKISIVNPMRIKHFVRSLNESAKTDKLDAQKLSLFGEKMDLIEWKAPSKAQLHARSLLKRREHLVEMRTLELQHLESEKDKKMIKYIKHTIKFLEGEIAQIETEIDEQIDSDKELSDKRKLLEEVKGIGKISAYSLLIYLPELGSISRETLAAIVGLAPYNSDSGLKSGKRYIRGGRKHLRDKLYMPTLQAIRHNEIIKEFASRLTSKGKPFKVVLIACMRKLLIHLNAKIKIYNQQSISV